jgi:hypothetical protein
MKISYKVTIKTRNYIREYYHRGVQYRGNSVIKRTGFKTDILFQAKAKFGRSNSIQNSNQMG